MSEFRKSTRCESHNCVEVATGREVGVRDSAEPDRVVVFGAEAWRAFIASELISRSAGGT